MMKKAVEENSSIRVPIYDLDLLLCITNDIIFSRKELNSLFGEYKGSDKTSAMCSSENGNFGLFFNKRHLYDEVLNKINHGLVSHEIFHMTHRMLEYVGCKFTNDNPESFAYLNGYLTDKVYEKLYE